MLAGFTTNDQGVSLAFPQLCKEGRAQEVSPCPPPSGGKPGVQPAACTGELSPSALHVECPREWGAAQEAVAPQRPQGVTGEPQSSSQGTPKGRLATHQTEPRALQPPSRTCPISSLIHRCLWPQSLTPLFSTGQVFGHSGIYFSISFHLQAA